MNKINKTWYELIDFLNPPQLKNIKLPRWKLGTGYWLKLNASMKKDRRCEKEKRINREQFEFIHQNVW